MFTGIIETTGILAQRDVHGDDQTLTICGTDFDFSRCSLGDSIAVNGVCLTAVAFGEDSFSADVSKETLTLTTLGALSIGQRVNLERALTPATPLGGHIVSGHVDGVGHLIHQFADGRSERFVFTAPQMLARYIAKKGSITIDGISLTVNDIEEENFHVNIVPHTMTRTTLGEYNIGQMVNLEVDLLARYVERLLVSGHDETGLTAEKLAALGF